MKNMVMELAVLHENVILSFLTPSRRLFDAWRCLFVHCAYYAAPKIRITFSDNIKQYLYVS